MAEQQGQQGKTFHIGKAPKQCRRGVCKEDLGASLQYHYPRRPTAPEVMDEVKRLIHTSESRTVVVGTIVRGVVGSILKSLNTTRLKSVTMTYTEYVREHMALFNLQYNEESHRLERTTSEYVVDAEVGPAPPQDTLSHGQDYAILLAVGLIPANKTQESAGGLPQDVEQPQALTRQQKVLVMRAFGGEEKEVLSRHFNMVLTRRDLLSLKGQNWLDDQVINFYMHLIIQRGQEAQWPKIYAFDTFMWPKLESEGPESLRRWTKNNNLFENDIIIVPIHLRAHWCMALIDLRDRSIRYYDSMGRPNKRCMKLLLKYLEVEHLKKQNTNLASDFKLECVKEIPQQHNGYDCGVFACSFAEYITRNARITFTQKDMPYIREKMVVEIITGRLLIT